MEETGIIKSSLVPLVSMKNNSGYGGTTPQPRQLLNRKQSARGKQIPGGVRLTKARLGGLSEPLVYDFYIGKHNPCARIAVKPSTQKISPFGTQTYSNLEEHSLDQGRYKLHYILIVTLKFSTEYNLKNVLRSWC